MKEPSAPHTGRLRGYARVGSGVEEKEREEKKAPAISEDTLYFVISAAATNFQLSATMGGAAIALTTDGDGDVAKERTVAVNLNDEFKFAIGDLEIDER